MNWDQVKGNWKQFKGKIQQQWGKLTNDDLDRIEGKQEELVGRLQARYGYEKEQAEKELERFCTECEPTECEQPGHSGGSRRAVGSARQTARRRA
jgi:uncharacterized protein YjbJ (UPF0337 family)